MPDPIFADRRLAAVPDSADDSGADDLLSLAGEESDDDLTAMVRAVNRPPQAAEEPEAELEVDDEASPGAPVEAELEGKVEPAEQ